jgi:soluble lytic murein transglycosylase-like protein
MIEEAAGREGYSPDLLRAVIRKESAFYPCAISPKGALGLMQLMPGTAANFGVDDPMNPADNLNAGAKFLGRLLTRYAGDLALALAAYNAGPGKVDAYGGVPPYPETKNYVREILSTIAEQ